MIFKAFFLVKPIPPKISLRRLRKMFLIIKSSSRRFWCSDNSQSFNLYSAIICRIWLAYRFNSSSWMGLLYCIDATIFRFHWSNLHSTSMNKYCDVFIFDLDSIVFESQLRFHLCDLFCYKLALMNIIKINFYGIYIAWWRCFLISDTLNVNCVDATIAAINDFDMLI